MDGRTSNDRRAKIVSQFIKDPCIRVLIFSSVGSSGLNLSRANTVIFLVRT
jgi:SNF2 family DNA or RNA helicase